MDKPTSVESLSPQQRRCLLLVGQGKTTPEIAFDLGIADGTVNGHIAAGMAKLGTSSRRQAGFIVLSQGQDGTLQKYTGSNLPVEKPSGSGAGAVERSVDAPAEVGLLNGERRDVEPGSPLKTVVMIAVFVAAILIMVLALKPLTQSARDVANALQPGRTH
jgi:DNA-binding CsgD family transcriptional regulator